MACAVCNDRGVEGLQRRADAETPSAWLRWGNEDVSCFRSYSQPQWIVDNERPRLLPATEATAEAEGRGVLCEKVDG